MKNPLLKSLVVASFCALSAFTLAQPEATPPETTSSTTKPASDAPAQQETDISTLLAQGEITFDASLPAALEVKRAPTGHLLVRPTINGQQPGWFIFDTGAGICVLSTPKLESLTLRDAGEIPSVGVGGSQNSKLYRADTMKLGPVTLRDHPLMATDLSFLEQYLGDEIAGIVGYGVLSRCVAELSIGGPAQAPSIAIFNPATFDLAAQHADLPAPSAWSTLKVIDRIPVVPGKVEDRDAWFRLDTGASGFVTLHAPAVEKWKLLEGRETTDVKLGGVGGFVQGKAGTLASVQLGGIRHENVKASFAVEHKGTFATDKFDGNVGAELIRPFTVVLDYTHQRVAFVPRTPDHKHAHQPETSDQTSASQEAK